MLTFHFPAAKVVEVSRRDGSTLSHLAYFDKVYLTWHGQFFFFRRRFIYSKSPQVTFLTESRLQVTFGPSQVGFTK